MAGRLSLRQRPYYLALRTGRTVMLQGFAPDLAAAASAAHHWLSGAPPGPVAARLRDFLALAFHQPRLRALRPDTSHWTLVFSGPPQWPIWDLPTVTPADTPGRYLVHGRDGRTADAADAAHALRLVLADLPGSAPTGPCRPWCVGPWRSVGPPAAFTGCAAALRPPPTAASECTARGGTVESPQ